MSRAGGTRTPNIASFGNRRSDRGIGATSPSRSRTALVRRRSGRGSAKTKKPTTRTRTEMTSSLTKETLYRLSYVGSVLSGVPGLAKPDPPLFAQASASFARPLGLQPAGCWSTNGSNSNPQRTVLLTRRIDPIWNNIPSFNLEHPDPLRSCQDRFTSRPETGPRQRARRPMLRSLRQNLQPDPDW